MYVFGSLGSKSDLNTHKHLKHPLLYYCTFFSFFYVTVSVKPASLSLVINFIHFVHIVHKMNEMNKMNHILLLYLFIPMPTRRYTFMCSVFLWYNMLDTVLEKIDIKFFRVVHERFLI